MTKPVSENGNPLTLTKTVKNEDFDVLPLYWWTSSRAAKLWAELSKLRHSIASCQAKNPFSSC
eukprot:1645578-Amphidinium_carterae.1